MHRLLIIVLSSVFFSLDLSAQDSKPLPTLLSPMAVSPNSASLGKFGEIPIGYFTGIPNVSVPIYEINTGGIKLPITLDYHAGGIKVEDIASWVGLGWALNAGGVITRQVRGVPDDSGPFNFLITHDSITKFINGTMQNPLAYFQNITRGLMDSERDLFFYSFGGSSGKFIFDTSGACIPMPVSKVRIEFGAFLGKTGVFKITDLAGNQYFFTDEETTAYGFNTNNSYSQSVYDAISSWYLTQINNVLNTDSITFSYGFVINNIQTLGTQTKYYGSGCRPQNAFIVTGSNQVHGLVMTGIQFKNGSVTFNRNSTNRCDLISDKSLSSIVIKNTDSTFYKKYIFYQTYSSPGSQPTTTCDPSHPENARLYLDSLAFSDKSNIVGKYKFTYLSRDALPSRLSFSQDLWGYNNGKTNTSLIPTVMLGGGVTLVGANRDCNFSSMQAGTLNSIVYPTGGRTEFQYEANTINNQNGNVSIVVVNRQFNFNIADPATPRLIDTTFLVTDDDGGGGVLMSWNYSPVTGCSGPPRVGCPLTTITDGAGTILSITASGNHYIKKGTIHVKLDYRGLDDNISIADLQAYFTAFSWPGYAANIDTLLYNAPVGGLRIKKMTDYTFGDSVASVKQYTYLRPDTVNYSSGTLLSYPKLIGSVGFLYEDYGECIATTINSTSNATLASDRGSYVTYKYVQELLGKNGEFGKNQYQFASADQHQDIVATTLPFAPTISRDWERGQLLDEKNFRYNSQLAQYELVKESIHKYRDTILNVYNNLKVTNNLISSATLFTDALGNYSYAPYYLEAGWSTLTSDTVRVYDLSDLTKYGQTTTAYTYSNTHYQPITITTTNSKGETRIIQNRYPLDYSSLTANDNFTSGIRNLQNRNVVTPVIENYVQLQNADGSNNRTIQGLINSYRPDRVLPDTIWATEFSAPSTSFTPTSVNGGRIIRNSSYLPQIEMLKYDPAGNIIEQRKKIDVSHTYIWDYKSSFPIAEVVNADSASVAYTSFEADGTGGIYLNNNGTGISTTDGITGKNCYAINNGLAKFNLDPSKTYIVSLWAKNGTPSNNGFNGSTQVIADNTSWTTGKSVRGWTYLEKRCSGVTTINVGGGGGLVDEVRVYPATAQMTTYTYQPLVGMTSQCDAASRITYYEYDSLQRLLRIRDMDGNIVRQFQYRYQAAYNQ